MYKATAATILVTLTNSAFATTYDNTSPTIGANDGVTWTDGSRTVSLTVVGDLTVTGGTFTPATVAVDRQNFVGEAVLTLGLSSGTLNPGAMTVGQHSRVEVLGPVSIGTNLSLSYNAKLNVASSLTVGGTLTMSDSSELKLVGGGISAGNFQQVDGDISGIGQITSGTTGLLNDSFTPADYGTVGTLGFGKLKFGPNSSYTVDLVDDGNGNWTSDLIELTGNAGTDADYPTIINVANLDLSTLPSDVLYPILTAEDALPAIPNTLIFYSVFSFQDGRELVLQLSDGNKTLNVVVVPEPGMIAVASMLGLGMIRRSRRS